MISGTGTPRTHQPDASQTPRYTGIRTFGRCPHTRDLAGVDVSPRL